MENLDLFAKKQRPAFHYRKIENSIPLQRMDEFLKAAGDAGRTSIEMTGPPCFSVGVARDIGELRRNNRRITCEDEGIKEGRRVFRYRRLAF